MDSLRYHRLPSLHGIGMILKQAFNALWFSSIHCVQACSWSLLFLTWHFFIYGFTSPFCIWHLVHASGFTLPMATWVKTLFLSLLPILLPGLDPCRWLLPALFSWRAGPRHIWVSLPASSCAQDWHLLSCASCWAMLWRWGCLTRVDVNLQKAPYYYKSLIPQPLVSYH